MATGAEIQATFQASERTIAVDDAEALSRELSRYRDLETVIAGLAHDGALLLGIALSYRAAVAEAADPAQLARRFRADASDHRAAAKRFHVSVEELIQRRTWASVRDDADALVSLERRIASADEIAAASERLANDCDERAAAIEFTQGRALQAAE